MKTSLSRADFLSAAASGRKWINSAFVLQYKENQLGCVRLGFTVTKKHGNAVARNRIKRRLREAVRLSVKEQLPQNGDYVVIARNDALTMDFTKLQAFATQAFSRIHKHKPVV